MARSKEELTDVEEEVRIGFRDLLRTFKTLHKMASNYRTGTDQEALLIEAARLTLVEMNQQGYREEMRKHELP